MNWYRRCIHISALDIPNVAEGLRQKAEGRQPDDREVVPGVLRYSEYVHRLATWNPQRIEEGIRANWYEGAEIKLFPPEWLLAAHARYDALQMLIGRKLLQKRQAESIGIDSGEGSANTCWAVCDRFGLIALVSEKTPNTAVIPKRTIEIGRHYGVPAHCWVFDRGGGGKQHADRLRAKKYLVRTVATGSPPQLEPRRGLNQLNVRKEVKEEAYAYTSIRVQMAHDLSGMMDPSIHNDGGDPPTYTGFALPPPDGRTYGPQYAELYRQLRVMPKQEDDRGRFTLPKKQKRDANDTAKTLIEMCGHSPDEFDAICLSVFGMLHKERISKAGVA